MVLNAYIVYKENAEGEIMSRYKSYVYVIEELCKEYKEVNKEIIVELRRSVTEIATKKEKDCCVCSDRTVPGGRKRSRTTCAGCS